MQCREIVSVVRMHHNHTFFVWKTKITFVCEIQQLLCFVSKVSPGQASPACRMALKTLPAWTGQDPPGWTLTKWVRWNKHKRLNITELHLCRATSISSSIGLTLLRVAGTGAATGVLGCGITGAPSAPCWEKLASLISPEWDKDGVSRDAWEQTNTQDEGQKRETWGEVREKSA